MPNKGFKLATLQLLARRSNQLSYAAATDSPTAIFTITQIYVAFSKKSFLIPNAVQ